MVIPKLEDSVPLVTLKGKNTTERGKEKGGWGLVLRDEGQEDVCQKRRTFKKDGMG